MCTLMFQCITLLTKKKSLEREMVAGSPFLFFASCFDIFVAIFQNLQIVQFPFIIKPLSENVVNVI